MEPAVLSCLMMGARCGFADVVGIRDIHLDGNFRVYRVGCGLESGGVF